MHSIFKIYQTVLKHKYAQSISQIFLSIFLSGFCYLKPLCSGGGIDVDHDDHDNKTRIVSDLKMTARERYDPGSLLLLLYIHGRVLFRLELQFINRLGFIFEIDNLSLYCEICKFQRKF